MLIDTDNAMGSLLGDVDDSFAIAALVRAGASIAAISAVGGNTSEPRAHGNNMALSRVLEWRGPLLRGSEVSSYLHDHPPMRIVALGPLTNLISAPALEIILVGGTLGTRGRWPPLWPHEFNLTRDRAAALTVLRSTVPLTIFPLDVCRLLSVTRAEINRLRGPVAEYLQQGSKRWFRRLQLLKLTGRFPIYDLAAALFAIDEEGFTMERTTIQTGDNTFIQFGAGEREVRVCRALDRGVLWARAAKLLSD